MCFEQSLPFPPSCQEKQVLTKVSQKGLVKKRHVVRQMLLQYSVNIKKVNSKTHIEQVIELFGNKGNIFQLQNESKTPMKECHFQSSWWSLVYTK